MVSVASAAVGEGAVVGAAGQRMVSVESAVGVAAAVGAGVVAVHAGLSPSRPRLQPITDAR